MIAFSSIDNLHRKQSLIRDRIRGVVHQQANGVYLHGRAGVSKTYLVRTTLKPSASDMPIPTATSRRSGSLSSSRPTRSQ